MAVQDLHRKLSDLPEDALVPVGWVVAQLEEDAAEGLEEGHLADLTCAEVAKVFNRSAACIRDWCRSGKLRAYRNVGREWRVPRSSIREFHDRQAIQDHGQRMPGNGKKSSPDLGAWRSARED
jgi:excisionase family DNA binding protein